MASRGSGRRTAGGRARHRLLVHLIGRVRGGSLGPGSCPLESVRDMETETRALALCGPRCPVWVTEPGGNGLNGTNGAPGFRILAALRNWNLARPYFRGRRALAVACPGGKGLGERACPLALPSPFSPETPELEVPQTARARTHSGVPGPGAPRPGAPRPFPPAAAAPTPSVPRMIAWSSGGSRHAG